MEEFDGSTMGDRRSYLAHRKWGFDVYIERYLDQASWYSKGNNFKAN